MKNLRITLAVTAGLLVAIGYVLNGKQPWSGSRIIVGTLFGCTIPWGWLKEPERSLGRGNVAFMIILLAVMIVFAVWKESVLKAVLIPLFCLAFGGLHFTMARLYRNEQEKSGFSEASDRIEE